MIISQSMTLKVSSDKFQYNTDRKHIYSRNVIRKQSRFEGLDWCDMHDINFETFELKKILKLYR